MIKKNHRFKPLLPKQELEELQYQAIEIEEKASRLGNGIHSTTIASIQELVRSMNSYYSNRIEGQSTHPINIERALAHDFSDKPDIAKLQRVAIAYIDTERALDQVDGKGLDKTLCSTILIQAHKELYQRLDSADRTTPEG